MGTNTVDFASYQTRLAQAAQGALNATPAKNSSVGQTIENAQALSGTTSGKATKAFGLPSLLSGGSGSQHLSDMYGSSGKTTDTLDGLKNYATQTHQQVDAKNTETQRQLAEAKQDKTTKHAEAKQAANEKKAAEQEVSKCETNVSNCEAKVANLKSQLSGLDSIKDAAKISQLKQMLQQAEQALQQAKQELQNAKNNLTEKTKLKDVADKAYDAASKKLENMTGVSEKVADGLTNVTGIKNQIMALDRGNKTQASPSIWSGTQTAGTKGSSTKATSIFGNNTQIA